MDIKQAIDNWVKANDVIYYQIDDNNKTVLVSSNHMIIDMNKMEFSYLVVSCDKYGCTLKYTDSTLRYMNHYNSYTVIAHETPLIINHYRYKDVSVFKYKDRFDSTSYATSKREYLNTIESLCDDVIRYEVNQKMGKFSPIICVCKKGNTTHKWMISQVDISTALNKVLEGDF